MIGFFSSGNGIIRNYCDRIIIIFWILLYYIQSKILATTWKFMKKHQFLSYYLSRIVFYYTKLNMNYVKKYCYRFYIKFEKISKLTFHTTEFKIQLTKKRKCEVRKLNVIEHGTVWNRETDIPTIKRSQSIGFGT